MALPFIRIVLCSPIPSRVMESVIVVCIFFFRTARSFVSGFIGDEVPSSNRFWKNLFSHWRAKLLAMRSEDSELTVSCKEVPRPLSFLLRGVGWDWDHLVCRPLIGLLYQPRMIGEYGAFGRMRISRTNRSTRRKPGPVSLQISDDLTWNQTRAAAVGIRRLTVWAMARFSSSTSSWLVHCPLRKDFLLFFHP
jgi:hypothetical protein